jgi:hypothetical protein
MPRTFWAALLSFVWAIAGCAAAPTPRALFPEQAPGALPARPELDAGQIVAEAHRAAGGDVWVRPRTLHLKGEAVFYPPGGPPERHERYEMWRVYPDAKPNAHQADGRVRIQSWKSGEAGLLLAFDGAQSYTANGPQPPSEADRQWSENFGFGVIRFALEPDRALERLPDDLVDGAPVFQVRVTDRSGGATDFAVRQKDFAIVRVGFATPRGWHERVYSDFYRKPDNAFVQPGRVRLFYNGVKQNEIFWTDFSLNTPMPDDLFVIRGPTP